MASAVLNAEVPAAAVQHSRTRIIVQAVKPVLAATSRVMSAGDMNGMLFGLDPGQNV